MDGTAVESAFALLLAKGKNRSYYRIISRIRRKFLNIAMTGVNKNYVSYLALAQRRGEKYYDKTNN
jgi:hypothetical protein